MSRWLEAAKWALPPADKTDKRDRTQPEGERPASGVNPDPVLSVLSVLSERGMACLAKAEPLPERPEARPLVERSGKPDAAPRSAVIRALRAGFSTPGAIATATKLGATATYQELDRMAAEGLLTIGRNSALGLPPGADLEAKLCP